MTVKDLMDRLQEFPDSMEVVTAEASSLSVLHPAIVIREIWALPYDETTYFGTDDPTGVEKKVRKVLVVA